MKFRTIPAHIAPGPEDVASLERKRAALADKLDAHAARERRIVAGMASDMTVDCVLRNRHLSRVLAGPVPLYRMQRGRALLVLMLAFAALGVLTAAAIDRLARPEPEVDCRAIAQRYLSAEPDSREEMRASYEMTQNSCYVEDATD